MSYMFRMITEECYECWSDFMSEMIDYSCAQCTGFTADKRQVDFTRIENGKFLAKKKSLIFKRNAGRKIIYVFFFKFFPFSINIYGRVVRQKTLTTGVSYLSKKFTDEKTRLQWIISTFDFLFINANRKAFHKKVLFR